jgi:predicted RNA binding protein YcfA (HicA-like mRNA interferase family)
MGKPDKLLAKMRANPRDWRMESLESLETVAKRHGIEVRKTSGSHFVFLHPDSELAVTIPFKRPIKPIYITQFLALLDDIGAE